jgi:SPX domain protein involved in polyphosphate accumulation
VLNLCRDACDQSLAIVLENLYRIGQEVIEIARFMELNLTAVRKILKKFDKKFKG